MPRLADELDPDLFWQIHRSTLVNVSVIGGVHRDFRGRLRVRLKDRKETLAVSEPYMHRFKHMGRAITVADVLDGQSTISGP